MNIKQIDKVQHMLAYIETNTTKEQYEDFVRKLNYFDNIDQWYDFLRSKYLSMVL